MAVGNDSKFLNKSHHGLRGTAMFGNSHIPWNKGLTNIWNHTEEAKKSISRKMKGSRRTPETKKKLSNIRSGRRPITNGETVKYIDTNLPIPIGWKIGLSDVAREKISNANSGVPKPPRSKEHAKNISMSNKGNPKPFVSAARSGGKWIHNEKLKKISYLRKGETIPDGWEYGRPKY